MWTLDAAAAEYPCRRLAYASGWRIRPTARSPPRSTNSATSYELDGAIIHGSSPIATPPEAVREASASIAALARAGRATELPGIGATIQEKVLRAGRHRRDPGARQVACEVPPGLVEMTRLPGLGPKRARRLFDELGIDSLAGAARGRRSSTGSGTLKGFGAKAEDGARWRRSRRSTRTVRRGERCSTGRSSSANSWSRRCARAPVRRAASSWPAPLGA